MQRDDLGGVYLSVISTKRPFNVARMNSLVGAATWYVGEGETSTYTASGSVVAKESKGLCAARNQALTDAFERGLPCVQLSDDLKQVRKMTYSMVGKKYVASPILFKRCITYILEEMENAGARLGGVAPTTNPLNYNPRRPVATSHFIVGDFLVVVPTILKFDGSMTLKEDYDYTLQHLAKYGVVARCDAILAEFQHYTNEGGAVDVRTPQREQENIRHLKSKWGSAIVDNPRRENEVLLKWIRADVTHARMAQ